MSRLINNLFNKNTKPGESTSSRPGWMVRDSHLTTEGSMTNNAAGTFTGLISQRVLPALHLPTSLGARRGPLQSRHPLMFISALALFSTPMFLSSSTFADSITVTLSGNPTITVAPTAEGTFADSGNITIGVTSTASSGYTLSITGSSTSLTGTTDNTKSITSIPTGSALSANAFNTSTYNNMWGYKPSKHYDSSTEAVVDNNNYLPSPDSNGDIIDIVTNSSSNDYTMSIGARVTSNLGFQTYENNTFVITAVGNSKCNRAATTIGEAICMQDMNDDVINSMVMNQQYTLTDERDDKDYYIAKMKDGRVWMTQNLDLDLSASKSLTSENTDLTTFGSQNYTTSYGYSNSNGLITWTPSSSATTSTSASAWADDNNYPRSFDYQDYYYYTDTNGTNTAYNTKTACTTAHNDGTCPHFHVGNYYNFTAAVASNYTYNIPNSTTMGNSICPAGWKLPNGQTTTTATDVGYYGEANYTLVAQNIISNYVTNTSSQYNNNGYLNLSNNPLYFARSGYKTGTSAPSSMGSSNYYWSSTVYITTHSYGQYFTSSQIYPSYWYNSRGYGFPVRCIAKQSNTGTTTITFNKNASDATGTTGTNNTQTMNANTINTLSSNGFSRSGYQFNSWNTQADGSGTSYTNAAQYYAMTGTTSNNVTLYAQWDPVWVITFNANGGTGSNYTQNILKNTTDYLSGNHFTRNNYYFKGWGTSSGTTTVTYRAGQAITPSSNMTLYAVWGSSTSTNLYNIVASLNNSRTLDKTSTDGSGLNAKAGIKSQITKENSGVFTYNASTFGTSSDASTNNTIYMYRGILDDNLTSSNYGSEGNGANYPNYVKLNNTCWRIIRTTGSGGVKLIYNGTYGATTSGSCANNNYKQGINANRYYFNRATSASTDSYGTKGFITYIGYMYNDDYGYNHTEYTTAINNDTLFSNSTPSNAKTTIETWFSSNMSSYASLLESSAGFCSDRSTYSPGTSTLTTSTIPYASSYPTVFFGATSRAAGNSPSLNCPDSERDLLTTSNVLSHPVALLTADEATFSGLGWEQVSNQLGSHINSYITSAQSYYLLSPFFRYSGGVHESHVSGSKINGTQVSSLWSLRTVVSLKSNTTPISGSGTATDPWVISAP